MLMDGLLEVLGLAAGFKVIDDYNDDEEEDE